MNIDIPHLRSLLEAQDGSDLPVLLEAMETLLDDLEGRQQLDKYIDKIKERYPESLTCTEVVDLLGSLASLSAWASPAPWEQKYGYNNGGVPTAFFKIPRHNEGKEVEMLAEDAQLIVTLRNSLPTILKALKELEDSRAVLSSLSSYLGAGMGGLETTIPQLVERIEWGVQNLPPLKDK